MVFLALGSLTLGTFIWHLADVFMLRASEQGRYSVVFAFMLLHVMSVPLFALSSITFFRVQRAWWIVEFPYYVIGLLISALLFRTVLGIQLTWREALAGGLLVVVALLVTRR